MPARILVARVLSVLGHPVVVIPVAVALLTVHRSTASAAVILSVVCGVGGVILAFSVWQVRSRRWRHVDASAPAERRSLNVFLAMVLVVGSAVALYQLNEPPLSLGLFLSGLLILVVMSLSAWGKVSLHAAFAAFAALLVWPLGIGYQASACVATAAICWSRVALLRHTVLEVLGGVLLGGFFGACFWLLM